jgi:GT2 family glycosyltransferase
MTIRLQNRYPLDIVTVTHNSEKYIHLHCQQIKECTGCDYRHHVVDNASSDRSVIYATIRNEHNVGYALACNQGAVAGSGDAICFMNPDVIVQPHWHHTLVDAVLNGGYAAAGPSLISLNGDYHHTYKTFLVGACYVIRRDVFAEMGGLDPRFYFGGDDNDLFYRLTLANKRWDRLPVRVLHFGGQAANAKMRSIYAQAGIDSARDYLEGVYYSKKVSP